MTQIINDFHAKCTSRAEQLAKQLGVEFKPLDVSEIEISTRKRIAALQKYRERKEEYDALLEEVFKVCTPHEVLEFIKNSKTK